MERRSFIQRLSLMLASAAGIIAGISFLRQFSRRISRGNSKVKVGRLNDFPVDTYTYVDEHKLFVYRDHEAMKAVSAVCTHLGCTIMKTTDGFECPCHGSCYDQQGEVLSGPAPTALSWYHLEKGPDNQVIVDLDEKTGPEGKFYIAG